MKNLIEITDKQSREERDEIILKLGDDIVVRDMEIRKLKDELEFKETMLEHKACELEKKLAVAVSALEEIADTDPDEGTQWFHRTADETLAKIRGDGGEKV